MKVIILENTIRCNKCGDIITSKHTHDFKWCSCGNVAVDGGRDYMKRCCSDLENGYEDLSVITLSEIEVEDFKLESSEEEYQEFLERQKEHGKLRKKYGLKECPNI